MDPEKAYWVEPWQTDGMLDLIMVFVAIGACVLLLFLIWKCCTQDNADEDVPPPQNLVPITPVYAHELEPGLVVLQSQDGSYFRILQEYDSAKFKNRKLSQNNVDCSGARNTCTTSPLQSATVLQYIPQYTRPHFQTRPSAPPSAPSENLIDIELNEQPPPYTRHSR